MTSSEETMLANASKRLSSRRACVLSNKKSPPSKNYIKTWSDYEKQVLLNLLYEHGDSDYEKLAEGLPNKHADQIKTYLRTVSRRAQLAEQQREKKQKVKNLDNWIDLLGNKYGDVPVDDSLPYHLFTLSKDSHKINEIVDFQKAYEYLYSLTVGRKIDIDKRTYYFVHSYIEWFLNEFEKNLASRGESLITTCLKAVSQSSENPEKNGKPNAVINLIMNKTIPEEFTLNYTRLLLHICSKARRSMLKSKEEFDDRISLLRAKIDDEPQRNVLIENLLSELVPETKDYKFKNLAAFVWAALCNYSYDDLMLLSKKT